MSQALKSSAHVFLFNTDAPELTGYYGGICNRALFDAVLKNTTYVPIHSSIFSGDLLLHRLCHQIDEVKKIGTMTSATYTVEKDLYVTLFTELGQSIQEGFNTIVLTGLPRFIAEHNIYGIVLTHLPHVVRADVDASLKTLGGYMGMFELDMGNPMHVILFLEQMIPHGFLKEDQLCLEEADDGYAEYEEDESNIPQWARNNSPVKVLIMNREDFRAQVPPLSAPNTLSVRGDRFRNIMRVKGKEDHYQKIAAGLLEGAHERSDFKYTVNGKLSYGKIMIPEGKLTEYALNFDHQSGKSKAKLFKDLLGITKENWRYLAAQLENGMADGMLCNVRKTDHGIQYHIDVPVRGLNGASKTVRTAWIMKENDDVSLTTVYIADPKDQQEGEGEEPAIAGGLDQDDFWETLYAIAHREAVKASEQVITTPLYITGYPQPIMEGACGFAYVVVKDARTGFAKWLKDKKIGSLYHRGGWEIAADTPDQSFEKAKAYAETFEKILKQNGVNCYVVSKLD